MSLQPETVPVTKNSSVHLEEFPNASSEIQFDGKAEHVAEEVQMHRRAAAHEELGEGAGVLATFRKNPKALLVLFVVLVRYSVHLMSTLLINPHSVHCNHQWNRT